MITGLSRNGIRVEGIGDGENGKVEIEENTAKSNGLTGILVTGSGRQLKKNVSGGKAGGAEDNGDCEFQVADNNFNAKDNQANGKKTFGNTGTPFPKGCIGTPQCVERVQG